MVISSLLVNTVADRTEAVAAELPGFPGVEVHEINGFKIVITIEAETVDDSHAIASKLAGIDGVLGVNLVYANFEDDPSLYPDGV
ncbi:MAG: chaperone NapD [Coriobacteriia bacterium]|nr:chaperone NapD [Coriobacteriia bacterium]